MQKLVSRLGAAIVLNVYQVDQSEFKVKDEIIKYVLIWRNGIALVMFSTLTRSHVFMQLLLNIIREIKTVTSMLLT